MSTCPPFKEKWPNCNVTVGKKVAPKNWHRCWHAIALDKLHNPCFDEKEWLFDIFIEEHRYLYQIPVRTLRWALTDLRNDVDIMKGPERYKFYLDFRTGDLYAKVEAQDKTPILRLGILQPSDYESLVVRIP